jgi:hypothetical protein
MTSTTSRRIGNAGQVADPVIELAEKAIKAWRDLEATHAPQRAQSRAAKRLTKAASELLDTFPQSLTGLFAKARVAHVTDDKKLAQRVVWDMNTFARLLIVQRQAA